MIEIKGNGNIISREFSISSFLRLHISTTGTVEMIPASQEKVVIETDENLLEYFAAVNSGRTLYISAEANFKKPVFTKSHLKIYYRQLDTLVIRYDGGNFNCYGLVVPGALDVKIQCSGNTTLDLSAATIKLLSQCDGDVVLRGKCNSISIKNQSDGTFSSKDLIADELTIKNMAAGNIELYAEKEMSISHYGSGYIHYYGDAVLKDVKQYGAGPIKHFDK